MGIPRKGSRTVEVDGRKYIFLVKGTHIPDHKDQPASTVVIQEDDTKNPGRPLRGWFFHGVEITPAFVQSLIIEGLKLGWGPSDRGAAFDLPPNKAMGRYHERDVCSYRG